MKPRNNMLFDQSYGIGMNQSNMFSGVRNGNPTPYQYGTKLSMSGSNQASEATDSDFPGMKDIHDAPKPTKTPILTEKGKVIFIVLVLGFVAFTIWQSHKAKKAAATTNPQSVPGPDGNTEIPTPSEPPKQPEIVDNSPKNTEIPQ